MVLLNTHPDYMCFGGKPAQDEFPVEQYEGCCAIFMRNMKDPIGLRRREKCRGTTVTESRLPLGIRGRKICMLAYTAYEFDNRVRRYAETLAKRGDKVDVIALGGTYFRKPVEEINGVRVYRVQNREYDERHKWTYAWRLLRFLWKSSVALTRLHERNSYDLIHIHNMPDFLVFAAWYPKLTGVKLILDVHDLVPELFASKFEADDRSGYVGLLKKTEKMSAGFVDHVIVSNDLWRQTLISRSVSEEKCSVFLNHVDPAVFYRRQRTRSDGKFIILFPGSFQWHQGLDIAIEAFAQIKSKVPNAELHLYGGGGGDRGVDLAQLAQRLGLNGSVKFCGGVSFDHIAEVIANADLGIVPKRADSFGNEAYSTKIMEFMSQGVPVVVSRTKIDSFYFDEGTVHFFPSGDSQAMAKAMLEVIENKDLHQRLVAGGYEYVERNGWQRKKQDYLNLVDSLSTEVFADAKPEEAQSR